MLRMQLFNKKSHMAMGKLLFSALNKKGCTVITLGHTNIFYVEKFDLVIS